MLSFAEFVLSVEFTSYNNFVDVINASAIDVVWEIPEIANGVVTVYRVHVNRIMRYEGQETRIVIGALEPFRYS